VYLVVLVAGLAMKIFDAGEGQEGEFEQGVAAVRHVSGSACL
jgi:hypothetical protein